MNIEKEREVFESAASALSVYTGWLHRMPGGAYAVEYIELAWQLWQARAKLEPQLPVDAIRIAVLELTQEVTAPLAAPEGRSAAQWMNDLQARRDERTRAATALYALLPPPPSIAQRGAESMSQRFDVSQLPAIDQQEIKRGYCPWCLSRLVDRGTYDECPDEDCGDTFHGKLTIED